MRIFPAPLLALGLSLLCGCADKTAIKVEVQSGLVVPDDLDRLQFIVVGDRSGKMLDRTFELTEQFPQSLSVRPGSDHNEPITITVIATKSSGTPGVADTFVARRIVHDAFVEGQDRTVRVDLPVSCRFVVCLDGVDCIDGRCGTGCMSDPECDNRDPCDGAEVCHDGRCFSPGTPDCDDHVACTADSCADHRCAHSPQNARCAPGNTCDEMLGCGGRPCTMASECDDGMFCNGTETCMMTRCVGGASPDCDDHDACTIDSCDPTGVGACKHVTQDLDHDMHGDAHCMSSGGVVADDCDDADAMIYPGAPEMCNGRDDNCDRTCDDGFACCRGAALSCLTSCGSMGSQVCGADCTLGRCAPPAETCNGLDDDCDGMCDNGVGCCQGTPQTCVTGCGSPGVRTCDSACVPGPCTAPPETCNGVDDDCNGVVDNGFPCPAGTVTSCATTCGTTGTRTCSATCALGACVPPAEVCGNGVDDNCNAMVDEGCTAGCTGTCTGATPITGTGGRFTATLGASTYTGSCGGAMGAEALYTFTLTSVSDVFITTHGSAIDTVLYVRSCACAGSEIGCNDNADARTSSLLQLDSLPGGTYTVFVDSKSSMSASVQLDVFISPHSSAGDSCGHPVHAINGDVTGNTCGLASDDSGRCGFSTSLDGPDRVYYMIVTGSADVTVSTCDGCTDFNDTLDIRTICNTTGTTGRTACFDDTCRSTCAGAGPARQARTVRPFTPGIYYVFVDGLGAACGNYALRVEGL